MKTNFVISHFIFCFAFITSTPLFATMPIESIGQSLDDYENKKLIIGAVEQVLLTPPGITMLARIDSGANTSALDARDIDVFDHDGQEWVRFVVIDRATQTSHSLERPLVRHAVIKQASSQTSRLLPQKRIVINLELRLAGKAMVAEFTLADREQLNYPVLVGRNVLQQGFLIDVSQDHVTRLQ